MIDLTLINTFFKCKIVLLPYLALFSFRGAFQFIFIPFESSITFGLYTSKNFYLIVDRSLGRARAGVVSSKICLIYFTPVIALFISKVINLPKLTFLRNQRALQQRRVPFVICRTNRLITLFSEVIENRSHRRTCASIVGSVKSLIFLTLLHTILRSKVIGLPRSTSFIER